MGAGPDGDRQRAGLEAEVLPSAAGEATVEGERGALAREAGRGPLEGVGGGAQARRALERPDAEGRLEARRPDRRVEPLALDSAAGVEHEASGRRLEAAQPEIRHREIRLHPRARGLALDLEPSLQTARPALTREGEKGAEVADVDARAERDRASGLRRDPALRLEASDRRVDHELRELDRLLRELRAQIAPSDPELADPRGREREGDGPGERAAIAAAGVEGAAAGERAGPLGMGREGAGEIEPIHRELELRRGRVEERQETLDLELALLALAQPAGIAAFAVHELEPEIELPGDAPDGREACQVRRFEARGDRRVGEADGFRATVEVEAELRIGPDELPRRIDLVPIEAEDDISARGRKEGEGLREAGVDAGEIAGVEGADRDLEGGASLERDLARARELRIADLERRVRDAQASLAEVQPAAGGEAVESNGRSLERGDRQAPFAERERFDHDRERLFPGRPRIVGRGDQRREGGAPVPAELGVLPEHDRRSLEGHLRDLEPSEQQ
jgi:hypothetical protein